MSSIGGHTRPINAILKIDGVPGESKVAGHVGAIDIDSFSWGVGNPTTIGSATGGAGAGKATFKELTITKPVDKSSAKLLLNCCQGAHYPKATLTVRKAAGATKDFLVFEFGTVFVASIAWSGPGDEGPEETISFVYGQVEIRYTAPDKSTSDVKWDAIRNSAG